MKGLTVGDDQNPKADGISTLLYGFSIWKKENEFGKWKIGKITHLR